MKFNLLALLKDGSLQRVVSSGFLQDEITTYFTRISDESYSNKTEIDFDGRYTVDDDEIFIINNYPLAKEISNAINNPLSLDALELNSNRDSIKAILSGCWDGNVQQIYFQAFDSRHLLTQKLTLLNAKGTYTKLEDPGLIIDERIDAAIVNKKLFFSSYHNARRILDLSKYYKEATDEDLSAFTKSKILVFEDTQWFIDNADSAIRKKVILLHLNKVLESVSIEEIAKVSKGFNIHIDVKKKQIILPKDKKIVKEILKFLDEDYFITPLTRRKCVTNSKRYLQ